MEEGKMWMACRIWQRVSLHPSHEYGIQIWETMIHGVGGGNVHITVCGSNEDGWIARAVKKKGLESIQIQRSDLCSHITHTLEGPIWQKILQSGRVQ